MVLRHPPDKHENFAASNWLQTHKAVHKIDFLDNHSFKSQKHPRCRIPLGHQSAGGGRLTARQKGFVSYNPSHISRRSLYVSGTLGQ